MVAAFTKGADPVHKISIIPRGIGALGYTIQLPTEDRFLLTEEELLGKIDVLLGGRASEEVFFGEISTGASNDITRATDIARKMITRLRHERQVHERRPALATEPDVSARGVGARTAGVFRVHAAVHRRRDHPHHQGPATAGSRALLEENKGAVDKVAKRLLEVETLGEEEFKTLLGAPSDRPSERV